MILCELLRFKLQGNKYFTISNNVHIVPSSGRKEGLPVIYNGLRKITRQKNIFGLQALHLRNSI